MVRGLLFRDLEAFSTFREESLGLWAVQEILSEVVGSIRLLSRLNVSAMSFEKSYLHIPFFRGECQLKQIVKNISRKQKNTKLYKSSS